MLVVTDANRGDSSEVEKAQWIEQVEEAAAARIKLLDRAGPQDPAQDLAVAVTNSGDCIRCRRKHEFRTSPMPGFT
jgi:hypothetical protein